MIILADINSWSVNGCSQGHYMAVARNYEEIFGCNEFIVAGGPVYHGKFPKYLPLPFNVSPGQCILRRKWRNLRNLITLMSCMRAGDTIVFQACAQATIFFFLTFWRMPKIKVYMIEYSRTECLNNLLKRTLWRMASHKISGVICPNAEVGTAFGIKYCIVPDYIALTTLPAGDVEPSHDFVFCGTVTAKKGIVEAAEYLARKGHSILVAGRVNDAFIESEITRLSEKQPSVTLKLGYLDHDAFDRAICSGKMLVLNYTDAYSEQSSGIVFDALFRGRPILGHRCKALEFVERFGLGVLYDSLADINIDDVLLEDRMLCYKNNIKQYLISHKRYAEDLRRFIASAGDKKQ